MNRRKVLVTLDGSEMSRQILPVIRQLFQPGQVEFTFLRIVQPLVEPSSGVYMHQPHAPLDLQFAHWDWELAEQEWQAYRRAVEEELKTEAQPFRRDGYMVHVVVDTGTPIEGIVNYLDNHQIELLAIATHGRRGLSKLMLGSVAEAILHKISIPILLKRPVESNTD